MDVLIIILISLALMVCNAIYCVQKIIVDFKHSKQIDAVCGLFALTGTLAALIALTWMALASLAYY
jgi:hypothetical protein